jgi:hypothetical protein
LFWATMTLVASHFLLECHWWYVVAYQVQIEKRRHKTTSTVLPSFPLFLEDRVLTSVSAALEDTNLSSGT